MLKDNAMAEDATQEIFVRVMRHIEKVPDDSSALYWMYRISTNYCLNLMRNHHRGAEPLGELPEMESAHPEIALQNRDIALRLVTKVPHSLRAAALLHYVDGLEQTQVAEVLGVSRRTVINHLQEFNRRARKFLARQEEVSIYGT